METELKLIASPAHLHKIVSQRLLQDFAATKPVTRKLTSHYFDTPDTALRKVGLSLRVRADAQQRTQTLKAADAAPSTAALHRGEWEAPSASDTPNLRALRKARRLPPEVAKALRQASRRGQLTEQFTVQAQRTTWMLDVDGASIELAFDEGAALANGAASTFTEIELEHKSGKKSALYTAAHALARHIPVQVSFVTKAERGFALLGEGMRPRKASAIAFPQRATVEQGLRRILAACLAHAQSNAQGFLDSDDPEYLHQLRVGMRRFRSALKLFRDLVALPPHLQQQLDATSSLLGAARDADVLVLTTLPRIRDAGRHGAFLQPLFDHAEAYAAGQRASAREAIHSTHHAQMMLALFEWVDGKLWRKDASRAVRARLRKPLAGYARHAVRDAHDVVSKRTRTVEKRGSDSTTLHRLRIGCKQARYAVEFFAGIARPRKVTRYVEQLSAVQDTLGMLNDMHVARTILLRFADADAGLVPAVGVVTAYLNGIAAAQLARPQAPWQQLAHVGVHGLVRRGDC